MTKREEVIGKSLLQDMRKMKQALAGYEYSFSKCREIKDKTKRSQAEEVELEAFTARFARLTDLLTQKLLKGLVILLGENLPTFIDRANYAEKIGLTKSAQSLRLIRELRNRIAHEYEEDSLEEIHALLFKVHEDFQSCIRNSMSYTQAVLRTLGVSEEE